MNKINILGYYLCQPSSDIHGNFWTMQDEHEMKFNVWTQAEKSAWTFDLLCNVLIKMERKQNRGSGTQVTP